MKIRNAAIGIAVAAAGLTGMASSALGASGTFYATDGNAAVTYNYSAYTGRTTGTLYDLKRNDAKCARVYSQGFNWTLGWGGWNLEKTVCAGGWANFSHRPFAYSDKIDLIVCTGYGSCVRNRIKG